MARYLLVSTAYRGHLRAMGLASVLIGCAASWQAVMAADVGVPHNPSVVAIARPGDYATLTHMHLIVNKSETVRVETQVGDVRVGSTEIADVIPVSDRTLYMIGKKVGTTDVSLFDANSKLVGVIDIVVGTDVAHEQEDAHRREREIGSDIRQATGAPGLQIRAQGDRIALVGVAPDAVSMDRAMQVAPPGTLNLAQVKSPQQVSLRVRFIEVDRSASRQFGVRYSRAQSPAGNVGLGTTTYPTPGDASSVTTFTSAVSSATPFATVFTSLGKGTLDVTLSALEQKGLVRSLAEPNLVALSGGTAEFNAGGSIPVPSPQNSGGGAGGIGSTIFTVDYKDYGVKLRFSPTVLANGLIDLVLEPEVSDIDPTLSVAIGGGITIPGLIKRKAKTEVQLRDGQSFAIAGLLQNVAQRNIDQLPWLGSIPVLGALFSSKSFNDHETELVVIVTPQLVRPAKPGQLLATPLDSTVPTSDADFFAKGQLELRPNMRKVVAKRGATIGPYGHVLPAVAVDQSPPACAGGSC